MREDVARYLHLVGYTLAAVALGHPDARRWATTLVHYRELLVEDSEDALQVMRRGAAAGFSELMASWFAET